MPLCLVFLLVFIIPHNTLIADFIASVTGPARTVVNFADAVVSLAALLLLYRLYARWVEGLGPLRVLLDGLCYFGMGALVQVVAFRLILFRLAEEMLGTWAAMALVAAVFGLAHLGNENATVGTSLALAFSDVLLASAFILSRRLWLVWGMHLGWNFLQDGLFGLANSGVTDLPSWITASVRGPAWLTGGSFGIEASPVQVLLSVSVGVLILRKAWVEGQVVRPAWRR
jgi:membrane protease YdiL (CAAX protease family)